MVTDSRGAPIFPDHDVAVREKVAEQGMGTSTTGVTPS